MLSFDRYRSEKENLFGLNIIFSRLKQTLRKISTFLRWYMLKLRGEGMRWTGGEMVLRPISYLIRSELNERKEND